MRSGSKRPELLDLVKNSPIGQDEFLTNLYLYQPATILAKILYLNELYLEAMRSPGDIFEFGVWYGANLSLLANLRRVYEPHNRARKVIGFDSFAGYPKPAASEGSSECLQPGGYDVGEHYLKHLNAVLTAHKKEEAGAGPVRYELVKGLVEETLPRYLESNQQSFVALAYVDLQTYEGTVAVLRGIKPRLLPGSVIALDEFTAKEYSGEAVAFREVFGQTGYTIRRSNYLPDRTIVTIK